MLVSHDRALLREVCDEFWLVAHSAVLPFDGDLDDYQRWLLEVSRAAQRGLPAPPLPSLLAAPPPAVAPPAAPTRKPATARAPTPAKREDRQAGKQARAQLTERTRPLRYEIKQTDERLAKLNAERAQVEAALAQPGLDAQGFADQGRRLAHIQADIARIEERWLELHSQLESIEAAS